ncbi:hypothetical protein T484DRAFT_3296352 [Baffinella frigidus]|nr:hypothetical protein T484DRAFT_3296352 [Cryptophyta sp. CCMP2293]
MMLVKAKGRGRWRSGSRRSDKRSTSCPRTTRSPRPRTGPRLSGLRFRGWCLAARPPGDAGPESVRTRRNVSWRRATVLAAACCARVPCVWARELRSSTCATPRNFGESRVPTQAPVSLGPAARQLVHNPRLDPLGLEKAIVTPTPGGHTVHCSLFGAADSVWCVVGVSRLPTDSDEMASLSHSLSDYVPAPPTPRPPGRSHASFCEHNFPGHASLISPG